MSQIRFVWGFLLKLAQEWQLKHNIVLDGGNTLKRVVDARYRKNHIDAFTVAYFLDPAFASRVGTKFVPPFRKLSADEQASLIAYMKRRTTRHSAVTAEIMAFTDKGYSNVAFAEVTSKQTNGDVFKPVSERLLCWDDKMRRDYPILCKEAYHLLGMHTTSCAPERN